MLQNIVRYHLVSSVSRLIGLSGGHEGRFSRDPLPVFSAGGPPQFWALRSPQFWHGQGCPLFNVLHPAFPLPTTASPTLQGALKDGFGEAVMACNMPEPCQFPSLDNMPEEAPWSHKEVDRAPKPDWKFR